MKVNGKFHMKKIFAWAIASVAIFANLAFLSLPKVAYAACSYTIDLTADKRSVSSNDQVTLYVSGTAMGDANTCARSASIDFQYKNKNGTFLTIGRATLNIIDGKFSGSYGLNLQNSFSSIKNNLSNQNAIEFTAFAQFLGDGNTGRSNSFTVSVSSTSATGNSMTVVLEPQKGEYSANDPIVFKIFGDAPLQSAENVFVEIWVNNKSIYNKTMGIGEFKNTFRSPAINVTTQNNYKNGSNEIRVEAWKAGTTLRLGSVTTNFLVKGLGDATPGTPAKTTNPGDLPQTQNPGDQPGGEADPTLNETLYNPLPTESLTGTILTIAKGFLAIVALWAVVFIIIGGFRMVLSQGNEEAYLAAKKTITWAVLGVVVAMLSFSIIAIVQSLLGVTVPDFPDSQTPVVKNQETNQ